MEKERTIHNLLGQDIYRISKEQITKLVDIITAEITAKTIKGISGVLDCKGGHLIQHGAFKGNFDDGISRRAYATKAFENSGIQKHQVNSKAQQAA